jgi:hypothetical protein
MSEFENFDYYIGGGNDGADDNRPTLESSSISTSLHIHIVTVSNLSKLIKKRTQGPSRLTSNI